MPSPSRNIVLADAVVAYLNDRSNRTFSVNFTAQRVLLPLQSVEQMVTLMNTGDQAGVFVKAMGEQRQSGTRSRWKVLQQIDIAIFRAALSTDDPTDSANSLYEETTIALSEEIIDVFPPATIIGGQQLESSELTTLYDMPALKDLRSVLSLATLRFLNFL